MADLTGTLSTGNSMTGTLGVVYGKDGSSAYEIALKNGFEGTEQEWLESLKGDPGIYLGSGDMPEDCNVQIDPNGEATTLESIVAEVAEVVSTETGVICEATGNPITLKDSSNRELQGLSLSNKNLFDESTMLNATGWTVENDVYTGGSYYLRQLWIDQPPVNFVPNTQYYICFYGASAVSGLNNRVCVRYTDGTKSEIYFNDLELTFKELVTTIGKSVKEIVLDYGSYGTISLSKFMICVASNNNAYAPYFKGGNVEVSVVGKNLWKFEESITTASGATSGRRDYDYLPVGVPLTLSADITKFPDDTATNTRITFQCFYTDGTRSRNESPIDTTFSECDGIPRKKSATITIDPSKEIDHIECTVLGYSSQSGRNAFAENIQLEIGSVVTTYEPYKEPQTLTVSVPDGFGTDGFVCEDFAQLHTYKPNTTITNDVGAIMKVEYVADTKAYIDNKFTELQNAILASGANV